MFGYTVPTAMFQSINAFAVMLCGVFLAWVVKESVAGNRTVRIWGKFALGLGLMSAGFCILTPYPTITIRGQLSDNMVYTEKHIRIISVTTAAAIHPVIGSSENDVQLRTRHPETTAD